MDWRSHGSMDRRQLLEDTWIGGHMNWRSHRLEVAWKHESETDWRTHGLEVTWIGGRRRSQETD